MAIGKDFLKQYWEGIADQTKLNMLDGLGNILSSLPQTMFGYGQEMLNGVMQNYFNRKSLDYQAQLNEQAAVNAYNRQLDFWHKQNAYNSPSAQMNRLRQAGLNPALINANGVNNVAGGLSSVAARSPGSPDHTKRSPTDAVNSLVGFAKSLKEMGFLDEQTKTEVQKRLNLIAERGLKEVDRELRIEERDLARLNKIETFEALYGTSIDGGEPTIKNNRISAALDEARSRKALNEANEALAQADQDLKVAQKAYQETMAQIAKEQNEFQKKVLDEQAKAAAAAAAASYANALANKIQAQYTASQKDHFDAKKEIDLEIVRAARDAGVTEAKIKEWEEMRARIRTNGPSNVNEYGETDWGKYIKESLQFLIFYFPLVN